MHGSITLREGGVKYSDMGSLAQCGPTDVSVKKAGFSGVNKGNFYVITFLSNSWEAFTPPHAGVTLGKFLC